VLFRSLDETLKDWWNRVEVETFPMADGLLRATAQICFGEQTEETIRRAIGWLRRRAHCSTEMVLEAFAELVRPRILVDKSPSTVYSLESMHRVRSRFPGARFLHLVRHPRGQCESVLRYAKFCSQGGPLPSWLEELASSSSALPAGEGEGATDPQWGWYSLNRNICEFLESVPAEKKLRVRGEDLFAEPEMTLSQITRWMGLRTDDDAIRSMMQPEESPYAGFGPQTARYGNDYFFLDQPRFSPAQIRPQEVEGPLGWRLDGRGFWPEVKDLAHDLGYR
jgi:hypothetical protein